MLLHIVRVSGSLANRGKSIWVTRHPSTISKQWASLSVYMCTWGQSQAVCRWMQCNAVFNYFHAIQVKSCFLISECTNWQAPGVWISSYSGNTARSYKWRVLTSFKGSWNTMGNMSNIVIAYFTVLQVRKRQTVEGEKHTLDLTRSGLSFCSRFIYLFPNGQILLYYTTPARLVKICSPGLWSYNRSKKRAVKTRQFFSAQLITITGTWYGPIVLFMCCNVVRVPRQPWMLGALMFLIGATCWLC